LKVGRRNSRRDNNNSFGIERYSGWGQANLWCLETRQPQVMCWFVQWSFNFIYKYFPAPGRIRKS
jgi:hypothetical protein